MTGRPPTHGYPPPSGPVPATRNGRVAVLIVAVVVLLIAGSVGVTLAIRKSGDSSSGRAVATTLTSMTTVTATSVELRAATTAVTSTIPPGTSAARATPAHTTLASPTGPQVSCRDGSSQVESECGNYQCWDDSIVTTKACPKLAGVKGLQWIFSEEAGEPSWSCKVGDPATQAEAERITCTWSDLSAVTVALIRWTSVTAAASYYRDTYGPGQTWTSNDQQFGTTWNRLLANNVDAAHVSLYGSQPYSIEILVRDEPGKGKGQNATASNRVNCQNPAELDRAVKSST